MAKIGYLRCSTDEDKQDVSRQLMNIDLDRKYIEYQSGKNEEGRPIFQEMLKSLVDGDTVYFSEMSRAGRNALSLQITIKSLVEKGVRVKFVSEGLVFGDKNADPMRQMMSQLILSSIANFNEFYLTQTSIAVKQGQQRAIKEGKLIGGSNPAWHTTFHKNRLLGNHKKSSPSAKTIASNTLAINELKKLISYSNDQFTLSTLAEKINSQGLTTSRGNPWSDVGVKRLLDKNNITYKKKNKHLTMG